MESDQATPEGIDEAISTLDGGVRNLAMDVALNQIEGWRLRLESSGSRSSGRSPTVRGGYRAALPPARWTRRRSAASLRTLGRGSVASPRPRLSSPSPVGWTPSPASSPTRGAASPAPDRPHRP